MAKLNHIKNYHFGMGLLILAIQIISQISVALYGFGFVLMLFSFYELLIVRKLKNQKGELVKASIIFNELRWVSFFTIVPILLLSAKLFIDLTQYQQITELLAIHPIYWINALVIGIVLFYFSVKSQSNKMAEEIRKA